MSSSYRERVYNVGIICALAIEKAAVISMLDETYLRSMRLSGDDNDYHLGNIGSHNVAISCLPAGSIGKVSAATVARDMMRSFPIKIGLLVGVAGGVWSKSRDIRLGDVVVSQPTGYHGGVVQWDFGKMEKDGIFRRTSTLNRPPEVLLRALQSLQTEELVAGSGIPERLSKMAAKFPPMAKRFCHQGLENDRLYEADYQHLTDGSCDDDCDDSHLVKRVARSDNEPSIHYGNIASGDAVMKDGPTRDRIAKAEGVICFEMEAAGLMHSFPCLVIRGICDYADSHKNNQWQPYAALTAAAYAKWLLEFIEMPAVEQLPTVSASTFEIPFSLEGVPVTSRFVGRKAELQHMEETLLPTDTHQAKSRRIVWVIYGLGGMGKTQLSIEYARQHADRYSAVLWINGSSKARINQSLLEFVHRIPPAQLSEKIKAILKDTSTRVAQDEDTLDLNHETIVKEIQRWLKQSQNTKWLMIIDNIDREYDEGCLSPREPPFSGITKIIPPGDHGTVIVTTRLVSLKSMFRQGLKIGKMNSQDAREILVHHELNEPITETELLIERLNGLPLALAQARAFIEQMGITTSAYINHYDNEWHELMKKQSRFPLPEYGEERSILTTWKISYDQVRKESEAAAGLMKLWAFLDCNDLWYELCASGGKFDDRPLWLDVVSKSELDFLGAMGLLNKYSLIDGKESKGKTSAYAMHSVLHKWCSCLMEEGQGDEMYWLAMRLVGGSVLTPSTSNYRAYDRRLLPHIIQLHRRKARRPMNKVEVVAMINMSSVLIRQARFDEAKEITQSAVQFCQEKLSSQDLVTLSALHHLGWVLTEEGSLGRAEETYRVALQGKRAVCGEDHASTLKTLRNLGHLLVQQSEFTKALALYSSAVTSIDKKRTLTTVQCDILDNMGLVYMKLGMMKESVDAYQRAWIAKIKLLGKDHLSTLDTVYNLGCVHMREEKYVKAEELLRKVLAGREKPNALGPDHADTAVAAHNLGKALSAQRKWPEASELLYRALAMLIKLYGEDGRTADVHADISLLQTARAAQRAVIFDSPKRSQDATRRSWRRLLSHRRPVVVELSQEDGDRRQSHRHEAPEPASRGGSDIASPPFLLRHSVPEPASHGGSDVNSPPTTDLVQCPPPEPVPLPTPIVYYEKERATSDNGVTTVTVYQPETIVGAPISEPSPPTRRDRQDNRMRKLYPGAREAAIEGARRRDAIIEVESEWWKIR